MRGTRSKLIMATARRIAKEQGVALDKAYIVVRHKAKWITTGINPDGTPVMEKLQPQQLKLDRCVRSFYQGMKNEYFKGSN